jgi:Holliday junction resolvase RusA-like endonuclease
MPKDYREWKQNVIEHLVEQGFDSHAIDYPVRMMVRFNSDSMEVQLFKLRNAKRPKYVRADIDNLVGGLMDALQEAGVVVDDRWILGIEATAWINE